MPFIKVANQTNNEFQHIKRFLLMSYLDFSSMIMTNDNLIAFGLQLSKQGTSTTTPTSNSKFGYIKIYIPLLTQKHISEK